MYVCHVFLGVTYGECDDSDITFIPCIHCLLRTFHKSIFSVIAVFVVYWPVVVIGMLFFELIHIFLDL